MNSTKNHSPVSFCDIEEVRDILYRLASEYKALAGVIVRSYFVQQEDFQHDIEISGTGLSTTELLDNPFEFAFTLPPSFGIDRLTITLKNALDGAFFVICPSVREIPILLDAVKEPDFNYEAYIQKERERDNAIELLPGNTKTIPSGYLLFERICVDKQSANGWLEILGAGLDYFIAGIEPLLKHRIISPTFG